MSTPEEQQPQQPPAAPAPSGGGGGKKGMMIAGVVVVLLVLVAVAAFLLYTPPPPAGSKCQTTDNKIKIGVALDQTGDIAQIGTAGVEALKMKQEEVNKAGGVNVGGTKCTIDLIIETDHCDGAKGTTAAEKLVNVDKVQVIIGGSCSGACLAIDEVAGNKSHVPQISPSCTGPQLTGRPWIFRTVPSDAYQSVAMVDLVMGLKTAGKVGGKIAVFSMSNPYGIGLHNAVIKAAMDKGLTVIKADTYDTTATTFESQLQVIKDAKAAQSPTESISVLLTSYNVPGEVIFVGANKLGMNQSTGFQWISNDGIVDSSNMVDNPLSMDAMQGMWGTKPTARPGLPSYDTFLAAYKTKYGKDAIVYVPESYDALSVAVAAIEKAGSYDGTAIKAALNSYTGASCFVGISGNKCYDASGDLDASGAYYVVYHVEAKAYKVCASYWDGVKAADGVKNFDGTAC